MGNTISGSYYSPSLLLGWLLNNRGVFFEGEGTASGGGSGDGDKSGGNGGGAGSSDKAPPADTDKGKGGDGGEGSGDPSKTPADKDDKGEKDKGKKEPITFTPEQHAEINRIVANAKRSHEQKLKADAEAEAAKAKGDFEKLYNTATTEIETLKPKAELADRLSDIVQKDIDTQIKDWPDEVKASDPGKGTDDKPVSVEERLRWVETHRELAKKLLTETPGIRHGHGEGTKVKPADNVDTGVSFRRPGKASRA